MNEELRASERHSRRGAAEPAVPGSGARSPGPDLTDPLRGGNRRLFLALLIGSAAISSLGLNLYLPSLPAMAVDLSVDFVAIQFTVALYLAAVAVGQLIVGPLSDRYGRRPILLVGLACFIVGSGICMLAPNMATLYVGRVFQALGGAAGIALSRAIVRDLYSRERAASMLSYVTMAVTLAPMMAPTIGGLIETWQGWRASFAFLAAFGACALVLAGWQLRETNPRIGRVDARQLLVDYRWVVGSGEFWRYALTNAFTASVFYAFIAGASYVMIVVLGRSPVQYGMYFAMVSLGYFVGNFCSGRYVTRFGTDRMIRLGIYTSIIAVAAMAALFGAGVDHPLALFVPAMISGFGSGLVVPSCVAGAVSVRPEAAGAASGLVGTVQMGSGAIVAPVLGAMLAASVWPLIWVMGVCAVLAWIAYGMRAGSR